MKYDLIIVGGGPAGAAATLFAQKYDLSVLLIDKENFPRDKICGDAVSGKSMTILKELDLLEEASRLAHCRIDSILFGSPSGHQLSIGLSENRHLKMPGGLLIKRKEFDALLFEKASRVADRVENGFKVTGLLWDEEETVCGVRGRYGESGGTVEFQGRLVLGADGFNSIVARKSGLYNHDPRHWVVALRQYYTGVQTRDNQIEIHYLRETQPGYFWIFPLAGGWTNVGVGMLHDTIKKEKIDLKRVLAAALENEVFKKRFAAAKPMEEPRGWNLPVGSLHRKNHGDGFMLLGDAAGLIDPFTGEGIGNALYSGKFAAETAFRALLRDDVSEESLKEYDYHLWKKLGNELSVSTRLQKVGRHQALLNFVIGKAERSEEVRDIISGMMRNAVPKKQLANPLFYLKLLFK
ncbi:MAG TPA: NAD(P)/FAD-dependent oxidoreductase [Caldithrix abyssi]|uniref:NAD(P)/FAD-dependent oxidoreductase n=1 Tax=Caldithrix abyssi TaxID=187145 RepID=A0A7V1LN33_CALAY|nr:NAD(P)/FAD-dependent oxidoreductase [Caldithrix abyssi]